MEVNVKTETTMNFNVNLNLSYAEANALAAVLGGMNLLDKERLVSQSIRRRDVDKHIADVVTKQFFVRLDDALRAGGQ